MYNKEVDRLDADVVRLEADVARLREERDAAIADGRDLVGKAMVTYRDKVRDLTAERDEARQEAASHKDAATQAFDAIAALCGCPQWEYPGQVVRDVEALVRQRDEADEHRRQIVAENEALRLKERANHAPAALFPATVMALQDQQATLEAAEAALAALRKRIDEGAPARWCGVCDMGWFDSSEPGDEPDEDCPRCNHTRRRGWFVEEVTNE